MCSLLTNSPYYPRDRADGVQAGVEQELIEDGRFNRILVGDGRKPPSRVRPRPAINSEFPRRASHAYRLACTFTLTCTELRLSMPIIIMLEKIAVLGTERASSAEPTVLQQQNSAWGNSRVRSCINRFSTSCTW